MFMENIPNSLTSNILDTIAYSKLQRHEKNSHKGMFGNVLIIGGSTSMHGALYLCGRSAMLMGSGKVVLAFIDENFGVDYLYPEIITTYYKNVIEDLDRFSVIVVGPGFGMDKNAIEALSIILNYAGQNKFIFDADALNLIAKKQDFQQKFSTLKNKIITPHPGEASRLLNISIEALEQNRSIAVEILYKKFSAITLLKGAGSLIYDGKTIYINQCANPALSNAGQGDTLCGIIAGFIAQGLRLLDALRFAVFLQSVSADKLVEEIGGFNGILASEVAKMSRTLLNKILYSKNCLHTS